jgi:hypothetical protein
MEFKSTKGQSSQGIRPRLREARDGQGVSANEGDKPDAVCSVPEIGLPARNSAEHPSYENQKGQMDNVESIRE